MLYRLKPFFYRRFKTSFSKAGEDIQLWQLLKKASGTYIDVGGHHPIFSSNSYFFYIRGWRGIVAEPNPEFAPLYKKLRPNDFFLAGGIADREGELEYFMFERGERNTFSTQHIEQTDLKNKVAVKKILPVKTLTQVSTQFFGEKPQIDFLTIDVEGMELEVLSGNNWEQIRPSYILLESHNPIQEELKSPILKFLTDKNYHLIGKTLQGHFLGTLWFRANEVHF